MAPKVRKVFSLFALVSGSAILACGGDKASRAPAQPATVSDVVVPASPPTSTDERVAEPEGPATADNPTVAAPVTEASSAPATSRPPEATIAAARTLFVQGVQAYQEGRYADARDAFEAAYQQVPKPQILYNLAKTEMKLGDTRKACAHLAAWLNDASPSAAMRQSASAELQACGIVP